MNELGCSADLLVVDDVVDTDERKGRSKTNGTSATVCGDNHENETTQALSHTLSHNHITHTLHEHNERERERETEKRAHSTPGSRDGSGQSAKHIDCKREEKHQKRHFTSSKEVIDAVFVPSWINT